MADKLYILLYQEPGHYPTYFLVNKEGKRVLEEGPSEIGLLINVAKKKGIDSKNITRKSQKAPCFSVGMNGYMLSGFLCPKNQPVKAGALSSSAI